MFQSARIKLTAWYLLIITFISVSFSIVIYKMLTNELDRMERAQRLRIERRLPIRIPTIDLPQPLSANVFLDPDLLAETKNRLMIILIGIDLGILGASAVVGYILAGRTLLPISDMVDEQNRFITDASHELRTPLTSLKSEIEVNLRDPLLSIRQTKKLLESNLEEVNNLQILSDSLIKLTQYQKGHNGLPMTHVAVVTVVKEAIRKVARAAAYKHISVTSSIKPTTIEGNASALIELFTILLDNAIKYSGKQKKIHLSLQKIADHLLIHIEDQGMGIHSDDIPHLFDRFYRADKSRTKSQVPGYGLGLSIAKEIVEKHHGLIHVASKVNKGSTFSIELPIKHTTSPKPLFSFL